MLYSQEFVPAINSMVWRASTTWGPFHDTPPKEGKEMENRIDPLSQTVTEVMEPVGLEMSMDSTVVRPTAVNTDERDVGQLPLASLTD